MSPTRKSPILIEWITGWTMAGRCRKDITLKTTHQILSALFSEDIHAKRVYSLANATLGVISSASLALNSIGQRLALVRGQLPKHAIGHCRT